MGRNLNLLTLLLLIYSEIGIYTTQAAQLNRVEIHYETDSQGKEDATANLVTSMPVDLVDLQITFQTIQKSLNQLQVCKKSFKTLNTF